MPGPRCGGTLVTVGTCTRPTAVLSAALFVFGLSGCSNGPTAREVQQEHGPDSFAAQQQVEAALAPLAGVVEPVATAVRDSCRTGQHNWKVDDPYDVRCTIEVHTAYLVPGEDFRAAADSVTQAFPACPEGESDAEATLRDYWDALEGTQTRNFEQPYRPDYLPGYRLDCHSAGPGDEAGATEGATPAVQLAVTGWATLPADEETRELREHAMGQPCLIASEESPCSWEGIPALTIFGFDGTDEGWLVFVSGSLEYARVG